MFRTQALPRCRLPRLLAAVCGGAALVLAAMAFAPGDNADGLERTPPLIQSGEDLFEEGRIWRATGFYSPELASGPAARACSLASSIVGMRAHQAHALHRVLSAGGGVLHVNAYPTAFGPDGDDYEALDQLVQMAREVGVRLLLTLDSHTDPCANPSGRVRSQKWYQGGYREPDADHPVGLTAHVTRLAYRYGGDPTVSAYQLVDGAPVDGDGKALASMHRELGRILTVVAPAQLRVSGAALNCAEGMDGLARWTTAQPPNYLDALMARDLGESNDPMPSCLQHALAAARVLKLPLLVSGGIPIGQHGPVERAQVLADKMGAAEKVGVPLYLVWSMGSRQRPVAAFEIGMVPPLVPMLQNVGLDRFASLPPCRPGTYCPLGRAMSAPEPAAAR